VPRVCVFAGSAIGNQPAHAAAAAALGAELGRRRLGLVYGGASVGLMGRCADAALAAGTEVLGVLPTQLAHSEIPHRGLTRLHLVEGLAERKAMMFGLSAAVVALPGGAGTLDELFEVVTMNQLGMLALPVGLLDVGGFYQPLLRFLEQARDQGLLQQRILDGLTVRSEVGPLLDALGL
jgi:uncharacterized protein (TIGR00730 family)